MNKKKLEMFEIIENAYFLEDIFSVKFEFIAEKVWIQRSTLYYYFKTKKILIDELIEYSFQRFFKKAKEVINNWDTFKLIDFLLFWWYFEKSLFWMYWIQNEAGEWEFWSYMNKKHEYLNNIVLKYVEKHNISSEKYFILDCMMWNVWKQYHKHPELIMADRGKVVNEIYKVVVS